MLLTLASAPAAVQIRIADTGSILAARRAGSQLAASTAVEEHGRGRHQRQRILRCDAEEDGSRQPADGGHAERADDTAHQREHQ